MGRYTKFVLKVDRPWAYSGGEEELVPPWRIDFSAEFFFILLHSKISPGYAVEIGPSRNAISFF